MTLLLEMILIRVLFRIFGENSTKGESGQELDLSHTQEVLTMTEITSNTKTAIFLQDTLINEKHVLMEAPRRGVESGLHNH